MLTKPIAPRTQKQKKLSEGERMNRSSSSLNIISSQSERNLTFDSEKKNVLTLRVAPDEPDFAVSPQTYRF